jgi:hypothetical protein
VNDHCSALSQGDERASVFGADEHAVASSTTDPAQLDRWFDRAIAASTAAEVFTD